MGGFQDDLGQVTAAILLQRGTPAALAAVTFEDFKESGASLKRRCEIRWEKDFSSGKVVANTILPDHRRIDPFAYAAADFRSAVEKEARTMAWVDIRGAVLGGRNGVGGEFYSLRAKCRELTKNGARRNVLSSSVLAARSRREKSHEVLHGDVDGFLQAVRQRIAEQESPDDKKIGIAKFPDAEQRFLEWEGVFNGVGSPDADSVVEAQDAYLQQRSEYVNRLDDALRRIESAVTSTNGTRLADIAADIEEALNDIDLKAPIESDKRRSSFSSVVSGTANVFDRERALETLAAKTQGLYALANQHPWVSDVLFPESRANAGVIEEIFSGSRNGMPQLTRKATELATMIDVVFMVDQIRELGQIDGPNALGDKTFLAATEVPAGLRLTPDARDLISSHRFALRDALDGEMNQDDAVNDVPRKAGGDRDF
jgi:hypothetical protein